MGSVCFPGERNALFISILTNDWMSASISPPHPPMGWGRATTSHRGGGGRSHMGAHTYIYITYVCVYIYTHTTNK